MIRVRGGLVLILIVGIAQVGAVSTCPDLAGWLAYGNVNASVVLDRLAYFNSGGSLMIADISDPTDPLIIGQALMRDSGVTGIAVDGGYAYVTVISGGLRVVDVRTPAEEKEVGFFNPPYCNGFDVAVVGDIAYVAMGTHFIILDVSTPSAPVELSRVGSDPGTTGTIFRGIIVRHDLAYLATVGDFRIYDVSTPDAPVELSRHVAPGAAYDVAISGEFAFLAAHSWGMRIIDIGDPTALVEVGRFPSPGIARRVTVGDGFAFLSEGPTFPPQSPVGIRILDVSVPEVPVEVAFVETGSSYTHVEVSGSTAFLSAGRSGLRILDVTNPGAPSEIGVYDPPDRALKVDADHGIAAVVTELEGLRIVDLTDPSSPTEIAHLDDSDQVWGVTMSDGLAYLADLDGNLRIIDLGTPSEPREVGRHASDYSDGTAYQVAIAGDFAYVIHDRGLKVVDVSRPESPVGLGSCLTPVSPTGIAVSGGYAYVSDFYFSLRVIDVRAPQAPVEVAELETPSEALAVAIEGEYAYVATEWAGLRVIDISDPTHPVEVGFQDGIYPRDVTVRDGLAFVAAAGSGFVVVDVRNPTRPRIIDDFDTPGIALDVSLDDDIAIVADYDGGVEVFDVSSCEARLDRPRRVGGRRAPGYNPSDSPVPDQDLPHR